MRRRGLDVAATRTAQGTGQTAPKFINLTHPKSKIPSNPVKLFVGLTKEKIAEEKTHTEGSLTKLMNMTHGEHNIDLDLRVLPSDIHSHYTGPGGLTEKRIFSALRHEPNGARGELGMSWLFGGAHSMAWEIVNGEPVIFDTQSGKMYKTPQEFSKLASSIHRAGYTRLDNVGLDDDLIRRWVKNAH
jgi:hypothetical protein